MNITGTQGAPLQIAKLVEQEWWMVAGAAEVAVVRRSFLFAMGRAAAFFIGFRLTVLIVVNKDLLILTNDLGLSDKWRVPVVLSSGSRSQAYDWCSNDCCHSGFAEYPGR
jgi:hypothetical protein